MIDAAVAALALLVCIWLSAAAVAAPEIDEASVDAASAFGPLAALTACGVADPVAVVLLAGAKLDSV